MVSTKTISKKKNCQFGLLPEEELQFAKAFIDHATDAVLWVNPDAQFVYVNDAACSLVGYSREELLSMTIDDVDPNSSRKAWLECWSMLQQQGSRTFESLHRTKAGWSFPVELTMTYVKHEGREYGCIFIRNITKRKQVEVALEQINAALEASLEKHTAKLRNTNAQLFHEIAEREQAELALRESKERLYATFSQAAIGIGHVGIDGTWLLANQKLCNIVGYPQSDLLQLTVQAITHPDDFKTERGYIHQILAEEIQTYSIEKRYIRSDGSQSWAHSTLSLVQEPEGVPKYFIAVVEDITERKRAEEALRQTETKFRLLAETTNAIIFISQGTQFCYVNPVTETVTGYTRAELLALPDIRKLIQARHRVKRQGQLLSCECEDIKHCEEIKILTKTGEERWLDCCVGVIEFEEKTALLGTASDITRRKQAEEEMRHALAHEKALSELRAGFVSIVSHEFRTPLNNVYLSTSSLRRYGQQWTEPEKLEYLCGIEADVEHLNSLLDSVLIFSMAEAGKHLFSPQPLDVIQFCQNLVTKMQLQSSQYTISFTCHGDGSNFNAVNVDKKLLHSILKNLLENAIKYSPTNSRVDLKLSCQENYMVLQVKDQGIGIPATDQQRLFEPFHRGRNAGNIQGTGLGLSIVKKFVDLHGGQIHVVSEAEVGTTFTITLPLLKL